MRPAPLPPCPPCAAHGGFQVCGSRAGRAPPTGQLGPSPQTAPDPSGAPCAPQPSPRPDGTTLGPSPVCTQAGLLLPPGDRLVSPLGRPLPQPSPSLVGPDDRVVSRPLPLPRALSLKSHQATFSHAWNHSPWSAENPCPRAATAACPGHPDLTSPATRPSQLDPALEGAGIIADFAQALPQPTWPPHPLCRLPSPPPGWSLPQAPFASATARGGGRRGAWSVLSSTRPG